MSIHFICPACNASLKVPDGNTGKKGPCPNCGQRLMVPPPVRLTTSPRNKTMLGEVESDDLSIVSTIQDHPMEDLEESFYECKKKHSGLGTTSFLIALLVVSLQIIEVTILFFYAIKNRHVHNTMEFSTINGVISLVFFNFLHLPLSLVGFGLGVAAIIIHNNRRHFFSWLGIIGNGILTFWTAGVILFNLLNPLPG